MSSSRLRVRTALLSVTTATALAGALAAVPPMTASADTAGPVTAARGPSGMRAAVSPRPTVVTLLTGDRVLVRHDARGRIVTSLTPRSRHYGKPVEFVNTGTHTWVVPRLAPSVRARFDTSVFDVAALARSGRVPLDVTFARGTAARSIRGLDVRTSSARTSARGRTTVRASYDARRPLPATLASSLRGVARIAVVGAGPAVDPAYELHTLTINGTTGHGRPLPGADVFVLNADDGRLFDQLGGIVDGQWKVSVPSGNYFVITSDFSRIVVKQVAVGDADQTLSLSMGDATVRPRMTVPRGLTKVSPSVDIIGGDEARTSSFDFGWGGIFPKVSPLPHVTTGRLATEVANLWSTKGYEPVTFHGNQIKFHPIRKVVAAKEVRAGIPRNLTFHYHRGDFAKVPIVHYATGPRVTSVDSWFGWSPLDFGAFVETFPTVRPGVVRGRFLGSRNITWDSSTAVTDDFRSFSQIDQLARYHRGQRPRVRFFRGPVAPVADRGGERANAGRRCLLCVRDGDLGGFMSMLSTAGTDQVGVTDHGTYALFRGHRRLDRGRFALSPFARGVKAGQRMRLVATTAPSMKKYVLSRHVTDTWRFRVPARARAAVPILRAAYVPPTNVHSVGRAGHVSYPVTFDNLGPVDARVAKAAVRWSVDGRHWHRADLRRQDKNTFRVSYRNPSATTAHPYLSLKVTARDSAGRSVSETVEHAYVLPRGRATSAHATRHRARFRPGKLCRTSGERSYSCFVELDAATRDAGRASPDPAGWGAPAIRNAYGIGSAPSPSPNTVAVIVAFDYPHAEADLNHYRAQFGLPACTGASGCFTKINQRGETGSYPERDYGWGVEASLDLQMISTSCPTCHIVLVEANQPSDRAFFHAEQTAVDAGATVTNHSWGRIELTGAETDALAFDHAGVTPVASTGDFGYGPAQFPASVPNVVAVGGTVLNRSADSVRGWTEKAWSFAGSGCSAYFAKPSYQDDTACHGRTAADVSAVARGIAIYNTSLPRRYQGWLTVDGTSASSPLIAGMIASDGQSGSLDPGLLYGANRSSFNDVVGGSNGFCRGSYLCTGVEGYDGPTGVGTPDGPGAFSIP